MATKKKSSMKRRLPSKNDFWQIENENGEILGVESTLANAKELVHQIAYAQFLIYKTPLFFGGYIVHYKAGKPVAQVMFDTEEWKRSRKIYYSRSERVEVSTVKSKKK